MKRINYITMLCVVAISMLAACTDAEFFSPKGPKGEKGDTGASAYEIWKQNVTDGTIEWPADQLAEADYFKFLRGNDGKDGKDAANGKTAYDQWKEYIAGGNIADPHNPGQNWPANKNSDADFWKFLTGATGENGQTPHIGANGNWFIGDDDTGVKAAGENGAPGKEATPPVLEVGANGNWFLNGKDLGVASKGAKGDKGEDGEKGEDGVDGATGKSPQASLPTIGANGNWFFDGKDTGKKAVGVDGKVPEVIIGENGNWYIGGKDSGKPAYGAKGDKGDTGATGTPGKPGKDNTQNGASAYELWKDYIKAGNIRDPHHPGLIWEPERNKQSDFWEFLTGVFVFTIEKGKYNVILLHWKDQDKEYVNPENGSVMLQVYDKEGGYVKAGLVVSNLPGVDPAYTLTTDNSGRIYIPKDKLPDQLPLTSRRGMAKVSVNGGKPEDTANNTLVPNRINMRPIVSYSYYDVNAKLDISLKFERQVDGVWEAYPRGLEQPYVQAGLIKDLSKPVDSSNLITTDANFKVNSYSYYVKVQRPMILTPAEKNTTLSRNDTIKSVVKYEWNGATYYVGVYVGDGEGSRNDYGQQIYLNEKFHLAEIYPTPGFDLNNVFVQVMQGVTTLWGQIGTKDMPGYYLTSNSSNVSSERNLQKDDATGLWGTPNGLILSSQMPEDRVVKVRINGRNNGATGFAEAYTTPLRKGGRFKLDNAYPGNQIQLNVYKKNSATSDYIATGEYRQRFAYYLEKDAQGYYLVDFADRTNKLRIQEKAVPADWMKE